MFVPATLVHTPAGPVRIDQLGPGALVTARLGDPGAPTSRPVAVRRTVRVEQAAILFSGYTTTASPGVGTRILRLHSTPEQPFWVADKGWTPASALLGDWLGPSPLGSRDGTSYFSYPEHVFHTGTPGIGWIGSPSLEGSGHTWNFDTERFVRGEPFDTHAWPQDEDGLGLPFRTTVFALELEQIGGLFVGEGGVLVCSALPG